MLKPPQTDWRAYKVGSPGFVRRKLGITLASIKRALSAADNRHAERETFCTRGLIAPDRRTRAAIAAMAKAESR